MANTVIQLKKSATPSAQPADLANGEIAINYADGKLFYKDSTGTIQQISGGGNTFSTVNAAGTLVVSDLQNDILTLEQGNNIIITGDAINDKITIAADLTPANSWANTKLSNGTVTLDGALTTTGQIYANSQITIYPTGGDEGGELQLWGAGSYPDWSIDSYQDQLRFFNVNTGIQKINFFNAGGGSVKLGVNTGNPQYELDVSGDVNVTGKFRINGTELATGTTDLGPANNYTNTSVAAANNYAGAMANAANAYASSLSKGHINLTNTSTIVDGATGNVWGGSFTTTLRDTWSGVYNSNNSTALFTFASGSSNVMSVQMDGSLFVGEGFVSDALGVVPSYGGWIVASSGVKSVYSISAGTDVNAGANVITGNVISSGYIQFADGSKQFTANAPSLVSFAAFDKANAANVLAYNTGIGANAYSDTVGISANNYSGVMANSSNGYAVAVGAAANNWANTKLSNTSGVVFGGNLTISQDLTIGNNITNVTSIIFNTSTNRTPTTPGEITWSSDDSTLRFDMDSPSNVIGHIGQDLFYYVKNQTGSTINKGTPVRFAGTLGSSGRLLAAPAIANNSYPSKYVIGVAAATINNGDDGFVLAQGKLRGIDTSAFSEGDILYVSSSTPGAFSNTMPTAPNNKITLAAVIKSDNTQGTIEVRLTLGSKLNEDELVEFDSLTDGDVLEYVTANGRFENRNTLVSAFNKANAANVLAYNTGIGANAYAVTVGASGNAYTNTVGTSANAYSDSLLVTGRAYTNTSTTAANNYAGFMANSANAYAASLTPDLSPVFVVANSAFDKANSANVLAKAAYDFANTLGGGGAVTVSNTAPVSPSDGDLWWNSEYGRLFVYYNDVDSSQWVDASPGESLVSIKNLTNTAFDKANSAFDKANSAFDSANSSNNYASVTFGTIINTTAAFAKANAALANTSGVYFDGNLFFPSGNVGIKRTTADYALDVVGTVNASALFVNGSALTGNKTVSVISTSTAAVKNYQYVAIASLTLTLPGSPAAGDSIGFTNMSATKTCVISPNGANIMQVSGDMTVDSLNVAFTLVYADSTRGWVFA